MRTPYLFGGLVLLGGLAAAQNPRPSTNLNACAEVSFDPQVATEGDLSIALLSSGDSGAGAAHIDAYLSDGRGIDWTGPTQIDGDGTGARKDLDDPSYVQIVDGVIHVIWKDDRGADTDVYYNKSEDGGTTWAGETLLDTALHGDTFGARMSVSGHHVYVCYEANEPGGGSDDQLLVVSSLNGGATFSTAFNPSTGGGPGSGVDVDNLDMKADDLTVHVVWTDDRPGASLGNGVFYQRSEDGGASWLVSEIQIDPGTGDATTGAVSLALDGDTVAVSYDYETTGSGNESLYVSTSIDGGDTWSGGVFVGDYTDVTHDVDNSRLMTSGGNLIAVWEDDRSGSDEIYVATSTDDGATWDEQSASLGTGGFPRVSNVSGGDEAGAAVCFTGGGFPETSIYAVSIDNGVTFTGPLSVSDTPGDSDFAEVKWNDLYNNYVAAWLSDECDDGGGGFFNAGFVGGVRPQTLTPNGFPGPPTFSFDFDLFNSGCGTTGWALASLTPGSLTLVGDGRELGVGFDAVLNTSAGLALAGVGLFDAGLDGSGSGSTTPFSTNLPPGTTLLMVGLNVDLGTLTICDISDVVTKTF